MNSFTVLPDFLELSEAARVVEHIRTALQNSLSMPGEGRNRILRYGWDYSTTRQLGEPPEWLPKIDGADSWTINQYENGRSIAMHIDSEKFGDEIKILSLGAVVFMRLLSPTGKELIVQMPPRSLAVMSGELRWKWQHGTLPVKTGVRYSIVYRTLRKSNE